MLIKYLVESDVVVNNFVDFFNIEKEKIFEINNNVLKSIV
jgi:hypothetical protein